MISISLCQWAFESGHLLVYLSYVFLAYGQSVILDKLFNLYIMICAIILQPSFYLMGDKAFRNDLSNKGLLKGLKVALIDR